MTTRYYQVIDGGIIKEIMAVFDDQEKSMEAAKKFANENGLGDPVFRRWQMFDLFLDGFKMPYRDFTMNYKDDGLWCIPKDGVSKPRARKTSKIHQQYKELCKGVNVDDKAIHDVLGWSCLDFFPAQPGMHLKEKDEVVVFLMPESCGELNGCREISNIDFMTLTERTCNSKPKG